MYTSLICLLFSFVLHNISKYLIVAVKSSITLPNLTANSTSTNKMLITYHIYLNKTLLPIPDDILPLKGRIMLFAQVWYIDKHKHYFADHQPHNDVSVVFEIIDNLLCNRKVPTIVWSVLWYSVTHLNQVQLSSPTWQNTKYVNNTTSMCLI